MNKKYISLLLLPTLLTGCHGGIELKHVPYSSWLEEQDLMKEETQGIAYKNGTINSLSDFLSDFRSGNKRETMPTKGDRKLLVVPISFTDSKKEDQNDKIIFLQNAFFGANDHTNYYSVAGYYNASSYGQLRITGEVAPWFNLDMSSSEISNMSASYMSKSSMVVNMALDYYKANNLVKNLASYDTDNDEDIDGIYAIYDHPSNEDNTKGDPLFWAYTHYTYKGEDGLNNTAPYVNGYSWTSINAVAQDDNRSYTNYLIHETGHLLGLTDYYNIKYTGLDNDYHYQPTGCFDVMDYNIGDHSSFSKYLFKWTSPKVVDDSLVGTIKLKPFTTSGEYLLIPSEQYKSLKNPFSEYLLIEYFAPIGVNKFSGAYSYTDANGKSGVYKYPQFYGLKIWHVNASLGYFENGKNGNLICRLDDPDWQTKISSIGVGLDYAYNNSLSDNEAKNGKQVLIHLLEASGKNTFLNGVPANNDTLFRSGDDFGKTKFTDFKFSDGNAPEYGIKVKSLSTRDITIEIIKK